MVLSNQVKVLLLVAIQLSLRNDFVSANCNNDTFACPASPGSSQFDCLPKTWLCDGEIDCPENGTITDESDCPQINCTSSQYTCVGANTCISLDWVCDLTEDCPGGDDESDCDNCGPTEFRCSDRTCIPNSWVCDGHNDCGDNIDEEPPNCPMTHCSPSSQFTCRNGICIDLNLKCNGQDNCGDGSDERNCNNTIKCPTGQVQCPNNNPVICISENYLCNEVVDCTGGWDESIEVNCSTNCSSGTFDCQDGTCIPGLWVCDGVEDCINGRDEVCSPEPQTACEEFTCQTRGCTTYRHQCDGIEDCIDGSDEASCEELCPFRCLSDHECLPMNLVCNGVANCSDSSDESDKCSGCAVNNGACGSHTCVNHPSGPQCQCDRGYSHVHGRCHDIDECQTYGTCDQICTNTPGSYKCSCVPGYRLRSTVGSSVRHSCGAIVSRGYLYVAAKDRIIRFSLSDFSEETVISGLGDVIGIAVDYKNNVIYWSEKLSKSIRTVSLEDITRVQVLVSTDIRAPKGLALDWVHQYLYWVDEAKGTVEVIKIDGSNRRTIKGNLSKPSHVAVDPFEETLYVSDWSNRSLIGQVDLLNSEFMHIVNSSMAGRSNSFVYPNGIALDLPTHKLYWVDSKTKHIDTIDTNGLNHHIKTLNTTSHPYSVALFENMLFWSDWNRFAVHVIDRFTGEELRTLPINVVGIFGLAVANEAIQPPGKVCAPPVLPGYNTDTFSRVLYHPGDELSVVCLDRHKLVGDAGIKCSASGMWSPSLPTCVKTVTPNGTEINKLTQTTSASGIDGGSLAIGFCICLVIVLLLLVLLVTLISVYTVKKQKKSVNDVTYCNKTTDDPSDVVALNGADELENSKDPTNHAFA